MHTHTAIVVRLPVRQANYLTQSLVVHTATLHDDSDYDCDDDYETATTTMMTDHSYGNELACTGEEVRVCVW